MSSHDDACLRDAEKAIGLLASAHEALGRSVANAPTTVTVPSGVAGVGEPVTTLKDHLGTVGTTRLELQQFVDKLRRT